MTMAVMMRVCRCDGAAVADGVPAAGRRDNAAHLGRSASHRYTARSDVDDASLVTSYSRGRELTSLSDMGVTNEIRLTNGRCRHSRHIRSI